MRILNELHLLASFYEKEGSLDVANKIHDVFFE
jgi:hypothetical protein